MGEFKIIEKEAQAQLYVDDLYVAYVSYDLDLIHDGSLEIGWIKSFYEGHGFAHYLMEWIYSQYPDHFIYWGECVHPSSLALADDFYMRFPTRTSYC